MVLIMVFHSICFFSSFLHSSRLSSVIRGKAHMEGGYPPEESALFSIRANMDPLLKNGIPEGVELVELNRIKAEIYRSVVFHTARPPETKELFGQSGGFSTAINRKYRLLWCWTNGKPVAEDRGITMIKIVPSDKQND
jgi:hypothetical protein